MPETCVQRPTSMLPSTAPAASAHVGRSEHFKTELGVYSSEECVYVVIDAQTTIQLPRHVKPPSSQKNKGCLTTEFLPEEPKVSVEQSTRLYMSALELRRHVGGRPYHHLPSTVRVPTALANPPTHVLAVYCDKLPANMYPVHAPVISRHFSALADLPGGPGSDSEARTSPAPHTLPVYALDLPNPESFSTILECVYTARYEQLYAHLLPRLPDPNARYSPEALRRAYSRSTLMQHVNRAAGVYGNLLALGETDRKIWKAMDCVWEFLLRAVDSTY